MNKPAAHWFLAWLIFNSGKEVMCSSKMLVHIWATWHYILEDSNIQCIQTFSFSRAHSEQTLQEAVEGLCFGVIHKTMNLLNGKVKINRV
jgi:hypothetical protein